MAAYVGDLGTIWCNNADVLHVNTTREQVGHDITYYLYLGIALLPPNSCLFTEFITYIQEHQGILRIKCPDNSLIRSARHETRFIGRKGRDPINRVRLSIDRIRLPIHCLCGRYPTTGVRW